MSLYLLRDRSPRPWSLCLAPLSLLKPHEQLNPQHFKRLYRQITGDSVLKTPLLVDCSTFIILDGHHRFEVLRSIGAQWAPVFLVDYGSSRVLVDSWRKDRSICKRDVLEAGLRGRLLPYKTSRHRIVGIRIPEVNLPLELLRRSQPW